MTTKRNFAERLETVVIQHVGQVKPIPYRYPQTVSGKQQSLGPVLVQAGQERAELPEDLARFMAYAG